MITITDHGNSVKQCLAIIETMTIEHVNVEHVELSNVPWYKRDDEFFSSFKSMGNECSKI